MVYYIIPYFDNAYHPVIKHGWLENPLWMEVLIGKSPINGPFSIAMFDYQRVMIEFDLYNDFILVSSPVDFRCTLRCQWNMEHDKFSNLSGWLIRDLTNPFPVLDTPKKQWLIVKDVQKIGPLKGVFNIGWNSWSELILDKSNTSRRQFRAMFRCGSTSSRLKW